MIEPAALVEAAAPLLALLDAVPWVADPRSLQVRAIGPQAVRLFGHPLERWTAAPGSWLELVVEEDRGRAAAGRGRAAAGRLEAIEYRLRSAAGTAVPAMDLVRLQPLGLVGVTVAGGRIRSTDAATHELNNALATAACRALAGSLPDPAGIPEPRPAILIVEDDLELRPMAARVLTRAGFQVHVADPGGAALEAVARLDVGLLVTDFSIEGSAAAALDFIARARAARPALRVLVTSGSVHARVSLPASTPFLAKPFTPRMLVDAVDDALA